jgi:hypothetical protein
MEEAIQTSYRSIKQQVKDIVEEEKIRIASDPQLQHLLNLR